MPSIRSTSLAIAMMLAVVPMSAAADDGRTLTVVGEGRADAKPDLAVLSLGVSAVEDTAGGAMTAMGDAMREVLGRLAAAGVAEADVQTGMLTLGINYDPGSYGRGSDNPGYLAQQTVDVRLTDLEAIGPTLDSVMAGGANVINGISFGLAEPGPVMDAARRDAIADAAARAEVYAEAAGVELGTIVSVTDQGAYGGPQPMMDARFAGEGGSAPVATGLTSMVATVSVTYAIGD